MRGCPVRDLLWQQVRKRSAGPVGCRQGAQGGLQDRRGSPAVSQFRDWQFPACQKPFLGRGSAMDRLPTQNIDSSCSGESSLRTARI